MELSETIRRRALEPARHSGGYTAAHRTLQTFIFFMFDVLMYCHMWVDSECVHFQTSFSVDWLRAQTLWPLDSECGVPIKPNNRTELIHSIFSVHLSVSKTEDVS